MAIVLHYSSDSEFIESPQVVLHRACKSSGSSSQGRKLGKHVISQEDMSELQLQISSRAYRIGSLQICQNDWHPQQQKDVDLAHQKQLLYIVPSCGRRTSVAVFEKDSLLLECCRCDSHISH